MLLARLGLLGPSAFATGGLAGVLTVIGLLAAGQASVAQKTRDVILQTRAALADVESLGIAMRDAETGQRGFMLTGDESYLPPYTAALTRIPSLMQGLRARAASDERAHALMLALTPLVNQKLGELARTIRVRREAGEAGALTIVKTALGRHLMIGVEAVLDSLAKVESRAIDQRRAALLRTNQSVDRLTIGGLAGGALMLVLASLMLRASRARQHRANLQRRAAEEEAHALALQLQTCFDNLTDGLQLIRAEPDGSFVYERVNGAALAMLGLAAEACIGRTVDAVWPDEQAQALLKRLRRCVADGHRVFYDNVPGAPDGCVLHMSLVPARTTQDGRVSLILGSVHDLTGQANLAAALRDNEARGALLAEMERLAERLSEARDRAEAGSRAKSRFLAGMSHELRTPLNGILGYAQLLRLEGDLSPLQAARVQTMLETGQDLLDLINRVLLVSELEAGPAETQMEEVDLRQLANACLDVIRPKADTRGLDMSLVMAPGVPTHVPTDPMRLRQLLLNLLGNAVKFTPEGKVVLRFERATDRDLLRMEVADTGPGVTAEQVPRLFRAFERHDGENATAVQGAGLGLALAARFASMMGGELGYRDNVGGGSVFWLELPCEPAAGPATDPADAGSRTLQEQQRAHAYRVLVVDDIAINSEIACAFLGATGLDVACADGGAEGVEAVANGDFDVVLMDVRMPDVDGLEATRRIRALPGARGRVPIVALTAQVFAEQVQACRQAGMDSHLAKPFTQEALLAAVVDAAANGSGLAGGAGMRTRPAAGLEPDTILDRVGAAIMDGVETVLAPGLELVPEG